MGSCSADQFLTALIYLSHVKVAFAISLSKAVESPNPQQMSSSQTRSALDSQHQTEEAEATFSFNWRQPLCSYFDFKISQSS